MLRCTLIIRADASSTVGAGHVMRCLAIAQAWQDIGGDVIFVASQLPDSIQSRIHDEGFGTRSISAAGGSPADAIELVEIAKKVNSVAIVLDGYQFDVDYHGAVADSGCVTLAIDDVGDLDYYQTDFVLNQNAGVNESLYPSRSGKTELLLGTSYALLRREFLSANAETPVIESTESRILVTLGGSDPNNITETVIDGLRRSDVTDLTVRVIVGSLNPHLQRITKHIDADKRFRLIQNVGDMSGEYRQADIVIAAGGSSNWEMCYFGLPRIVLVIADNQIGIARELDRENIAVNLGDAAAVSPEMIHNAVQGFLHNPARLTTARKRAMNMVDGLGAARCVDQLNRRSTATNEQSSGIS